MSSQIKNSPRVFISYSWDSTEHQELVLELADRLREEGIDCWLDKYIMAPPEGWYQWMVNQIEQAEFVLVVCTERYYQRFRNQEEAGRGLGVTWEAGVVMQYLYNAQGKNTKVIPVLFSLQDSDHIPEVLRGSSRYILDTEEGYEMLYRHLTKQPITQMPELGKPKPLPPRERKQGFFKRSSGGEPDLEEKGQGNSLDVVNSNSQTWVKWSDNQVVQQLSLHTPALAVQNEKLHMVFVSDDSNNTLSHCVYDGNSWIQYSALRELSKSEPALVSYNGKLHLLFVANNQTNDILHCIYDEANKAWFPNQRVGQSCKFGCSLAVHAGKLFLLFAANNDSNTILQCTYDGTSWSNNKPLNESTSSTPAIVEFNGRLHLLFVANNLSKELLHWVYNDDFGSWSPNVRLNEQSSMSVSLAAAWNQLYMLFLANNNSNEIIQCVYDGSVWTQGVGINQSSKASPSLAFYKESLHTVFPANNSTSSLLHCIGTIQPKLDE